MTKEQQQRNQKTKPKKHDKPVYGEEGAAKRGESYTTAELGEEWPAMIGDCCGGKSNNAGQEGMLLGILLYYSESKQACLSLLKRVCGCRVARLAHIPARDADRKGEQTCPVAKNWKEECPKNIHICQYSIVEKH